MADDELPFFHKMLAALLECPEDETLDRDRARLVLDMAGSDDVEAAIMAGDPYAAALYRLAQGETRASLLRRIMANVASETEGEA